MIRIVVDATKCVGCRVCESVCSLVNEGEANPSKARIKVVRNTMDSLVPNCIPVLCQQCETSSCELVCPAHAISRNAYGALIVDEEKCLGCKLCEIACPNGAITVNAEKHISMKCNLCVNAGGDPQCAKHCYRQAIKVVEVEKVGKAKAIARSEKVMQLKWRD